MTLRRLVGLLGETPALVDSTGVGDAIVEGLQKQCPGVEGFKFTAPSKQQLMEQLAVAIQQGEVAFPDGPISMELEQFEYQYTRAGVRYAAPEGLHDDCVCALALAVRAKTTAAASISCRCEMDYGKGKDDKRVGTGGPDGGEGARSPG
jgi:hypothetical protein